MPARYCTSPMLAITAAMLVGAGCGGTLSYGDGTSDTGTDTGSDSSADTGLDGADTGEDAPIDESTDVPADWPPADTLEDTYAEVIDGPCATAGCGAGDGLPCCAGLAPRNDCLPGGPPCPTELMFCTNCGNGICGPHENAFNCPADCPEGCTAEDEVSFPCSPIETQVCSCESDPCTPFCEGMGPRWIDPCTGEPIPGDFGDPSCFPLGELACLHIGLAEEGWYDTQMFGEHLVRLGPCQKRWTCNYVY